MNKILIALLFLVVSGCDNTPQTITGFAGADAEQAMINTAGNAVEISVSGTSVPTIYPVTFNVPANIANIQVPAGCEWAWDTSANTNNLAFWANYNFTLIADDTYFGCNSGSYSCTTISSTPIAGFGYKVDVDCIFTP